MLLGLLAVARIAIEHPVVLGFPLHHLLRREVAIKSRFLDGTDVAVWQGRQCL
jgi:hypothetical protein